MSKPWGRAPSGAQVELFTLQNKNGVTATFMNHGATWVGFTAPDRAGKLEDVLLGFDNFEGYLGNNPYFGCTTGRYANRIRGGTFVLDGRTCKLATNDGASHLHGGNVGFNKRMWEGAETANGITFRYTSPDGEEGYPGTLRCSVTFSLSDANALAIHYEAVTDAPTVLNLTNHAYFNLDGSPAILDHTLMLAGDHVTAVDADSIPTGEIRPVASTPVDFRTPTRIGARIDAAYELLKFGQGYDLNWCLPGSGLRLAAVAQSHKSGRVLSCYTDQPAVQFYSGNYIGRAGDIKGKGGAIYRDRSGFCLETQHYPDSPNHANFPSTVLRPGQVFRSTTVYTIGVS